MPKSPLTAKNVLETLRRCLFKDGEETTDAVKVEGITAIMGFHPDRLEEQKAAIEAMLDELPEEFKQSSGGGWSFLNACNDRRGKQWTGLHKDMEILFCLGIATGRVRCQLPREVWPSLPGGVPYYIILDGEPPSS